MSVLLNTMLKEAEERNCRIKKQLAIARRQRNQILLAGYLALAFTGTLLGLLISLIW